MFEYLMSIETYTIIQTPVILFGTATIGGAVIAITHSTYDRSSIFSVTAFALLLISIFK